MGFRLGERVEDILICQKESYSANNILKVFVLFGRDMKEIGQYLEVNTTDLDCQNRQLVHPHLKVATRGNLILISKFKNGKFRIYTMGQVYNNFKSVATGTYKYRLSEPICLQYNITMVRDVMVDKDGSIFRMEGDPDLPEIKIPLIRQMEETPEYVLTLEHSRDLYSKAALKDKFVTYLLLVNGIPISYIPVRLGTEVDQYIQDYMIEKERVGV